MTPHERETTVVSSDGSPYTYIWTCQRTVITKLRRNKKFEEVRSGEYIDGTLWAEFRIPADQWNPASGAKKQYKVSEERRAELVEQVARARAART